jgi:hypothetical protein
MGVPIRRLLAETTSADLSTYMAFLVIEHESNADEAPKSGADLEDFKRAFNVH